MATTTSDQDLSTSTPATVDDIDEAQLPSAEGRSYGWLLALLALIVLVALLVAVVRSRSTGAAIDRALTHPVARGDVLITITEDGQVWADIGGQTTQIGDLEIATFVNATGLKQVGYRQVCPRRKWRNVAVGT